MNWDHVRFFVAVVRAGTVVGAARRLGVSHATALRNVARLEKDLGVRLFDRARSGYRVTEEGEEIYADALVMEERAQALARRALGKNPVPEGLLKLVVPDRSLISLMLVLRDFRHQYPRIDLSLGTAADSAGRSINQFEADVAIVATNTPPEDLVGRQLSRINFAVYATAGYLAEKGGVPLQPSECEWVTWDSEESVQSGRNAGWQQRALHRLTPRPNVVLRAASHGDAEAAVRSGVGVGILGHGASRDLEVLPFNLAIESLGIWILTHPDLRRSGRIRAFMEFVAEHFLAR